MAARSVRVTFTNKTTMALVRTSDHLDHGDWGTEPPPRIEAAQSVGWESESAGVATGTEGNVHYTIEGLPGSDTYWYWDDPFVGSNSYDQSVPETFKATRSGGGGDNANVTWVFDDASSTGDGIPDDWKVNGVTVDPGDGSGPQFIDLKSMGADVNRPDIFVQLDWMADSKHSHAPSAAAVKTIVDAFANAPYISKNGSIGINLHVDAGPDSILNFTTNQTWGSLSRARKLAEVPQLGTATVDGAGNVSYDWTELDKIKNGKNGFTSTGRTKVFRYCVSAHQIGTVTNSGVARAIPGSDFIISLGTFTGVTDTNMSGTVMHELGHCLGLGHGGGDGTNNKANYVSVMNYLWQFSGVTRGGATLIDYSNAALLALNEAALNETKGLGAAAAGVAVAHWVPGNGGNPGAFVQVADGSQPIDWDGDGLATNKNVAVDTNNDGATGNLAPYDDWKNLKLRGGSIGAGGAYAPPQQSSIVEITPAEQRLILRADITPPVTTASVWPMPNGNGWNRTDVQVTFSATDDISGVARTECNVDGTGSVAVTAPVNVTTEGVHGLDYFSIDRSQNIETAKHLDVRIDKTAPEAVISYDPVADDIVVTGRDSLAGVDPGPVPPVATSSIEWSDFGSDVAELRVYQISDHADNTIVVALKVRCSPLRWEASILDIRYDDVRHQQPSDGPSRHQDQPHQGLRGDRRGGDRERNTIVFERVVGRDPAQTLLGVKQVVSVGEGDSRTTIRARYDVLDDLTLLEHETGSACCGERETTMALTIDLRGLLLLHVATHNGRLVVEE